MRAKPNIDAMTSEQLAVYLVGLKSQYADAIDTFAKQKLYHAIRYIEKRTETLEHQNEYYNKNRETRLVYDKKYQETHKDERRVFHQTHNEKNKDLHSIQHVRYELEHKEERRVFHRIYYSKHVIDYRERTRKRRALLKNADGSFTETEFQALCKTYENRCAYCGREKPLVADHMTPLCRRGSNSIENITPACQFCNSSKGDKTYDEYIAWCKLFKGGDADAKNT